MNIQERLAEFFRRLEGAASVATAQEAMNLVCRLIEEVEDALCPLPRNPRAPMGYSGRMYAPQSDHIKPGQSGSLVANTRKHSIHREADGTITIVHITSGKIEITKPGKLI